MSKRHFFQEFSEAFNKAAMRFGASAVVLLFLALLVITPWLFEQWAIYGLQNNLQVSSARFSQELELRLENTIRSALRRTADLTDPVTVFEQKSADWLSASDELLALRLVNADGQTLRYAAKAGMPGADLQPLPLPQVLLAHSQELGEPSFSALYELNEKKLVDLYTPFAQASGWTLVMTLNTESWTALADALPEMSGTSVQVLPFVKEPHPEWHHLRVNHPKWEGHWTLEFKSRELTANMLKILRPVFAGMALIITCLLVLQWRNRSLRLRAEKDAIEKSRLLEKQSRLSLLGEMSASLAHEINQPLAIISNYAAAGQMQLQLQQAHDLALLGTLLQKIQEQSQRAAQVLVSVRGLLHQGPVQAVLTDIDQLLRNLKPQLQLQAQGMGVEFNIEAEPGLKVVLDPILFEQVVLNLFKNSLQALEKSQAPVKKIRIAVTAQNDRVHIEVSDTGEGIAPEHVGKIFDSFFTTKNEGLGIGLNLCRSVIERLQGRLLLKSNGPNGACFLIDLPRANVPEE